MKAVTYHRYGSPNVLDWTDVDTPTAGPGQVLVRTRAASINFGDLVFLQGSPAIARLGTGLRRPREPILGRAIAGTVEAVGVGVTGFATGDRVLGEMNQRGFAEYVAAPAQHLATFPDGVTFAQAATLPIAAVTALQAIRRGDVGAGQSVLINGASGGVGTFAVQLAAARGATVVGVCSARNAELVASLGAAATIDYAHEDVTAGVHRFDVVLDFAGGVRVAALRRVLTDRGVYVGSSGAGGLVLGAVPRILGALATAPFVRQRVRNLMSRRSGDDLATLADMVAAGTLTPVIDRTYPLREAADAFRSLETDHARGKTVLMV